MAIFLHQFVADFDLPNPSPFCMKVETFLRLAGLDYEVVPWSPTNAPMGKAPVVVYDGDVLADSSLILTGVASRAGIDLDAHVPERELALARAVTRVLEEHTYWALLWIRWVDPTGWAAYRPIIGTSMPVPGFAQGLLADYLRRGVRRSCWAHGLTRHTPDEIHARAIQDLDGVVAALGDRLFLGGDRPCSHDASASAFLEQLAHPLLANPTRDHLLGSPTLVGYLQRMRASAWSDRELPPLA